ncbi:MAG: CDP-alcohol phosphatidyltransferase family protein [Candidatus Aenigmarchaeota archaeon]|nr:CDP-alcohol phosphatidyltransferase family protein [Candidatus Aenigmarchaeota archaeon]
MLSSSKKKFGGILDWAIKPLKRTGISPNQLTLLSLLLAAGYFYAMLSGKYIAALFLVILSIASDALDGHLARETKRAGPYGAYLDTIADRYVEFIIFLSFLFLPLPTLVLAPEIWIALCVFGSLMTTYSKAAYSEKTGKSFSGGLLERPERTLALIAGIILINLNPIYLLYIIILLAFLTNLSAIHRIYKALGLCTQR